MSWKRWPYWLRGGVIGAMVTLVVFTLERQCLPVNLYSLSWWLRPLLCSSFFHWEFISSLLILPVYPIVINFPIFPSFGPPEIWDFILIEIPAAIFSFGVGALIGGLIGRRKSKKQAPPLQR